MGLLDPHVPVSIVAVEPGPPHLEPSISAHVIFIQHPLPEWSSPLITIYDLLSIEATHSGLLLHCPIKLLTVTF